MGQHGSNRRDFLKVTTASAAALGLGSVRGQVGARASEAVSSPFTSLTGVFEAARGQYFGVKAEDRFESFGDGKSGTRRKLVPRDSRTYYLADGISGEEEPHSFQLSFEITNNRILCSATQNGLLKNPCIFSRMVPARRRGRDLTSEELAGGSAWSFGLRPREGSAVRLPMTHGAQVSLLGSVFPVFQYQLDDLQVELLVFAPRVNGEPAAAPRALLAAVRLHNRGPDAWQGSLLAPRLPDLGDADDSSISTPVESPHPRFTELPVPIAPGYEAVMCLDETRWSPYCPVVTVSVPPGKDSFHTFALLLGTSVGDLRETGGEISQRSLLGWFNQTWGASQDRYGDLSIPSDPYYSESVIRLIEGTSSACLYSKEGGLFRGGPSGCVDYGMMLFEPRFLADVLRSLSDYQPRSGGAANRESLAYSLVNSLGLLPSAGLYYRSTGDAALFREAPGILEFARERLADILSLRLGERHLFASTMLWDGPTLGDFHTGSNIMAWLAFQGAGRLAREVYGEVKLGSEWEEIAERIRRDIYRYCVGESRLGPRFFEGANLDGTFALGHNGEEAFTTLAPFFGFCEADDPALINHARLAFTEDNPLYEPAVDGIWWGERGDRFSGVTTPGQLAMLVANNNESELGSRLEQLRTLTDLDGSIWWWPYLYPCNDPRNVRRRDWPVDTSKSGFTMAVAACLMIHNILGLSVDVPARRVALRPFSPWDQFSWDGARLGHSLFDFACKRENGRLSGRLRNRNSQSYHAVVELLLPGRQSAGEVTVNGVKTEEARTGRRFGRPTVRFEGHLAPESWVDLSVALS